MKRQSIVLVVVLLALTAMTARLAPGASAEPFLGKKLVDRYQVAVLVANLLVKTGVAGPPADRPSVFRDLDGAHARHVAVCVEAGVLQGFDGRFHGKKLINRYQLAIIAARLADKIGVRGTPSSRGAKRPADVHRNHWAARAVEKVLRYGLVPLLDGKYAGKKLVDRYTLAHTAVRLAKEVDISGSGVIPNLDDVPPDHPRASVARACARAGLFRLGELTIDPGAKQRRPSEDAARVDLQNVEVDAMRLADALALLNVKLAKLESAVGNGKVSGSPARSRYEGLRAGSERLEGRLTDLMRRMAAIPPFRAARLAKSLKNTRALMVEFADELALLRVKMGMLAKRLGLAGPTSKRRKGVWGGARSPARGRGGAGLISLTIELARLRARVESLADKIESGKGSAKAHRRMHEAINRKLGALLQRWKAQARICRQPLKDPKLGRTTSLRLLKSFMRDLRKECRELDYELRGMKDRL